MNRRIATLLAAGTAGALALALPLTAAPDGTSHTGSAHTDECNAGRVTVFAPETMWPPNHKYDTSLYVEAVAADPVREVVLKSVGYHDQYEGDAEVNGSGGGNGTNAGDDITSDDKTATVTKNAADDADDGDSGYPEVVATEKGTGSVRTDWKARAERSGRIRDGRTYSLTGTATFSDGNPSTTDDPTCTKTWEFKVPHDMRASTRGK